MKIEDRHLDQLSPGEISLLIEVSESEDPVKYYAQSILQYLEEAEIGYRPTIIEFSAGKKGNPGASPTACVIQ